jgi:uncharacterized protein YndB with AHSA1/START domain
MTQTDLIEKATTVKAPPSRVWQALADSRQYGEWFGVTLEGPFEVGKRVAGTLNHPDYAHLPFVLVIEALEPERRLAFRWHPHAVEADHDYSQEPMTLVEFLLAPVDGGTHVTVRESGFDQVPEARRALALRMNEGGWAVQVENLRGHAER